jgi:hypothetical protein
MDKNANNYLNVKIQYGIDDKYNINPKLCNSGAYSLQKKKMFSVDLQKDENISFGNSISIDDFNRRKSKVKLYIKKILTRKKIVILILIFLLILQM